MSNPLTLSKTLTLYRTLTAPDDSSFCHKVTEALSLGWSLYGSPALTFDAVQGRTICGQAVTRDVSGVTYDPALKLSQQ